ncbi:MAG: DUF2934 domain-containing protein [Pirellulales bacterium]
MAVRLDTLEMTPEQYEAALDCVRRLAYEKWLDAGQPPSDGDAFWLEAEREWIERYYVPPRAPMASPAHSQG